MTKKNSNAQIEEIKRMFADNDEENYRKFSMIKPQDRLHENMEICGLLKLYQIMGNPNEFNCMGCREKVIICSADEIKEFTEDDVIFLIRCGLSMDGDYLVYVT